MQSQAKQAMCGFCGRHRTKGQMQPAANGGGKCKDWFECAQHRELMLQRMTLADRQAALAEFNRTQTHRTLTTNGGPMVYTGRV